ncbi:unnamed protein product [Pedinophyceae sp. YPF-701]|nr:unnamed protein product [Pedinophyceae sp. YPF-701]
MSFAGMVTPRGLAATLGLAISTPSPIAGTPRARAEVAPSPHEVELAGPEQLADLRVLVASCLSKHMYEAAHFFADKFHTLSGNDPAAAHLLGHALMAAGEHRRALAVMAGAGLIHGPKADVRVQHLAGLCLGHLSRWEEVLGVIGDGEDAAADGRLQEECRRADAAEAAATGTTAPPPAGTPPLLSGIRLYSAICLLRGRAYDARNSPERAARWLKAAVRVDTRNFDALSHLLRGHFLSAQEEQELLSGGEFPLAMRWLQPLYRSMCKMNGQEDTIERQLAELEGADAAQVEADTVAQSRPGQLTPEGTVQPMTSLHLTTPPRIVPAPATPQDGASGPMAISTGDATPMLAAEVPAAGAESAAGAHGGGRGASDAAGPMTRSRMRRIHTGEQDADVPMPEAHRAGGGVADRSSPGGLLPGNPDVLACRAEWMGHQGRAREARDATTRALAADPGHRRAAEVHIAACVALHLKQELFELAHRLVAEAPDDPLSWYAVGCYYLCSGQPTLARQHLHRATSMPGAARFAAAWIAYGHAYSALDEADQALAAYRTAARRFRGLHIPVLGIAAEYQKTSNLDLALEVLSDARDLCKSDPLVWNELAAVYLRRNETRLALDCARKAMELLPQQATPDMRAPLCVNLGHALRRECDLEGAMRAYREAHALAPEDPGAACGVAVVHHARGELKDAVDWYHRVLMRRPKDEFAKEMLDEAVRDSARELWVM